MEQERRRHLRARLNWPVSILIGEESFERSTFDIGPDGAFVRGLSLIELYEVFDMTVIGPDHPIKTKARVVWSRNEVVAGLEQDMPRGMGVEFIKISDEDWNFVSSFISDLEFAVYLESATTNEVEDSLIHQHLIEEQQEEYINNAAQKSPKKCPRGHKHLSWSADEDYVFCWDCNKRYDLAKCLDPKNTEAQCGNDSED
jgi:hypothetical protein